MLNALKNIDQQLLLINGAHNELLDFVMWWASDKLIWIPFYAWFLYLMIRGYGKKVWPILLAVTLMIISSDQLSGLIKNSVQRLRPSHAPALFGKVHSIHDYLGGTYGFVSSHAANCMAIAVFLWMLLPPPLKIPRLALIPFVILVSYSRVYLGVHYPLDILGGWLVGMLTAGIAVNLVKLTTVLPEKQ